MKKTFGILLVISLHFIIATSVAKAQTNICSAIATDTTWESSDGPFVINCSFAVTAGATLTIKPGTIVQSANGIVIEVAGTLNALGTESQPITFTSQSDGTDKWYGINVIQDGSAVFDHVIIEKTAAALSAKALSIASDNVILSNSIVRENSRGINVGASATIENTDFINNGDYGIAINGSSAPEINNVKMSGNGGMAIRIMDTSAPVISNVSFDNNGGLFYATPNADIGHISGINLGSGNGFDSLMIDCNHSTGLTFSRTWDGLSLGMPITVVGYPGVVSIGKDATLTITPGTIVKFGPALIFQVDGKLIAEGTPSQPITFTSQDDSSHWYGISVLSEGAASFDNVVIEKASFYPVFYYWNYFSGATAALSILSDNVILNNSVIRNNDHGLYLAANAIIKNSVIKDNAQGLNILADAKIDDTDILNNQDYGITISGSPAPVLKNVKVSGNSGGVHILGSAAPFMENVLISGNSGYAFSAHPSTNFEHIKTKVEGNGNDAIMIDASRGGGYSGSRIWDGASLGIPFIVLSYPSTFSVGKDAELTITPGTVVKFGPAIVFQVDGKLIAKGTPSQPITFTSDDDGSRWYGISVVSGAVADFDNVIIEKANNYPFWYYWNYYSGATAALSILSDDVTLKNSVIRSNNKGVYVAASSALIENNDFYLNSEFSLKYVGDATLNIGKNYWGALTGPSHLTNPLGRGQLVVGTLNIFPFMIFPETCPPIVENFRIGMGASRENLVVITHGWNGNADNDWVKNMRKNIYDNSVKEKSSIRSFDWREGSNVTFPWDAYINANHYGLCLAKQIIDLKMPLKNIHLIAHSAGSNVIQTAVDSLTKYYSKTDAPLFKLTFLDAYAPFGSLERYGNLSNFPGYAEQYVDTRPVSDWLVGPLSPVDATKAWLAFATNFDVTALDLGNNDTHSWPVMVYDASTKDKDFSHILGFPFSSESGRNVIPIKNNSKWCHIRPDEADSGSLTRPYAACTAFSLTDFIIKFGNDWISESWDGSPSEHPGNITLNSLSKSETGTVEFLSKSSLTNIEGISQMGTTLIYLKTGQSPNSPVWFEYDFTLKEEVNMIKFSALFPSSANEGVLSIFLDGKRIYSQTSSLFSKGKAFNDQAGFSKSLTEGSHKIRFRLDSTSDESSEVYISDIKIGLQTGGMIQQEFEDTSDNVPPISTSTKSGTGGPDWFSSDVQVTLTATDNAGGSGVLETAYYLDGDKILYIYNGPFTVSGEGVHELEFYSIDKVGNFEVNHQKTQIKIDLTAPVIVLLGSSPIDVAFGSVYVDEGAMAIDNINGNIISSVVTVGSVDTSSMGMHTIHYEIADAAGNPATPVSRIVNVVKADQIITFGALSGKTYGDADFNVSASSDSALAVSFNSQTNDVCTVFGSTVHIAEAGTCTIRAIQDGDSHYYAAINVDQSFTVSKAPITISAAANIKVFDNNKSALAIPIITSGMLVNGDVADFKEFYDSSFVGINKTLIPAGIAGSNAGGNYDYTFISRTDGIILSPEQVLPEATIDGGSGVRVDDKTPEALIIDPSRPITVTVASGTKNPSINISAFVNDGIGPLPEINIFSDGIASVTIPEKTTVTSADPNWNGVISAPTLRTVTLPNVATSTAIEIGFSGGKLTFDRAVRILLPNQAGKLAGYSREGIAFIEILNECSGDSQTVGDGLMADSECKINVGNDLVIWTKHFTTFVAYLLKDTIAPTTTIVKKADGGPMWFRSDVSVTLSAVDNADGSGVDRLEYSLDKTGIWVAYVKFISISSEGVHELMFRSIDKAGNIEKIRTEIIKIDKTAPEATVGFNQYSSDLEILGSDNLSKTKVVQVNDKTYTVTDEAGHFVKLSFSKIKDKNRLVKARLESILYSTGGVYKLPKTNLVYVWDAFRSYVINQIIEVRQGFIVYANYDKRTNKTEIIYTAWGGKVQKIKFDGLKIIKLLTKKGELDYSY